MKTVDILFGKFLDRSYYHLDTMLINRFECEDEFGMVDHTIEFISTLLTSSNDLPDEVMLILNKIKDHTLKLDGAGQYLINNFTSYDGFISFLKNDINYWKQLKIEDYEQNYLIALLDMLLYLTDKEFIENYIIFEVMDEIDKFNYIYEVITLRNKNKSYMELSYDEFEKYCKILQFMEV